MTDKTLLSCYLHSNAGSRCNLARILDHGALKGTGKMVILPVDQGFEHGPEESFIKNPDAYNPEYHIELAIESGLSAYAAPIGMIEDVAYKYPGKIPLILKLNSASSLFPSSDAPSQAFNSAPKDALKLGCVGIGLTLYPGSSNYKEMLQIAAKTIKKAKSYGLLTIVWSYPRGGDLKKEDETALDVISYGAHMACLIGADIVKVKPPADYLKDKSKSELLNTATLRQRVEVIKRAAFDGKRIVLFSGGKTKSKEELYQEITQIKQGGADGSIIGRNVFQRSKKEALSMLEEIIEIYKR